MDIEFLNENMMGPNAWLIAEELTANLPLKRGDASFGFRMWKRTDFCIFGREIWSSGFCSGLMDNCHRELQSF